jgi:tape measure domain-containing protein
MATIDDKVVAISFESSKFESGVNKTIGAIDKLKGALTFHGAGKGLEQIEAASKKVDLSHIAKSVDDIKGKFSALSVAALAVIANIAQKVVGAGANFVKAFTLDPAKAGFQEYSTNLNAVQTILANTQASGAKLSDVNDALFELNKYSDKTIYNFSQMARNIGTFTAAGVDLKTSTESIKGIANLAALSGSNSEQASTAMYQLSQAISSGRVGLQDWNSVVNAGMGGTVFQRALATTAENMGKLKEGTLKLVGPMKNVSINGESFRQSIQAAPGKTSWLTSDVLTNTLKQFTGDLTDAQLKAEGFNAAQIKAIQQTAKTAQQAATEVKTISQVLDVAKETAGSGWAQTFQIIFGNFSEAKKTFTELSNTINGFINTNSAARNKVLADWKELGGRAVLIDGIKTAFHNLIEIIKPIKDAFQEVFPPKTGQDLFNLTQRFHDLAEALKPSPQTIANLHDTFKGLFSVLDIGKQIIGGIFTVFGKLFGAVSSGNGGFLDFTATIGRFLTALDEALKKSGSITDFFSGLGSILAVPIKLLEEFGHAIGNLFGGFSSGGFSGQMDGMTKALTPFQKIMEAVSTAWTNFLTNISSGHNILKSAVDGIANIMIGLGPAISNALSSINWDAILAVIRTGLLGGIVLLLKNFFGKGSFVEQISEGLSGFGGGILKNIAGSFSALEGSMVAMQQNLKAKTLKEIAIAIALLAASVLAISLVNPDRLGSSITAIGGLMAMLVGAMASLNKVAASSGFVKLPLIAGGLVLLAGAIDILVIAVVALSRLSWEELLKGLAGVGGLLVGISAASGPLSANSAGMIRAGIGIGAIAVSMKILASAMADFAGMSWGEIAKGLGAVAGGLVTIAGAAKLMPPGMVLQGAGLIAVAAGLKILASAVEQFGGMDWGTIGKGLAGIGGSLVVIAGAMQVMPPNMPITAAGLLLVAVSLGKIASAVESMGGMSISEIAKGLGTLAGSLTILAAALYAMSGTLAGAAALTTAAAGIALLAPALVKMGDLSWGEILKSLVELGGALTVLGIAGIALAPTIPALLGLGAALTLIGAGMAGVGAGIFLISTGISALAVTGPAGIRILIDAILKLTEAIPQAAKNIVLGLLEIVKQIANTAPQFVDAILKIIDSLLTAITKSSPKIETAFTALLTAAIKILHDNEDKLIQAGFDLILALLKGLEKNAQQIATAVGNIIAKILNTISTNLDKIITAGESILTSLLQGVGDHIANVVTGVAEIIAKFLGAVADNLGLIITAGYSILTKLLQGISDNIGNILKTTADVISKFVTGIGNGASQIVTAGVDSMIKFIDGLSKNGVRLANAAGQAILDFLNGIEAAVNRYEPQIIAAGVGIGAALVTGLIRGVTSEAAGLYNTISGVMSHAMSLIHKIPLIHSPSQVTTDVGMNIILGLVKGMEDTQQNLYSSVTSISNELIDTFKNTFQITSPSKVMHDIGQAVGQGFAQGLTGSQDDIRKAFTDLNNKLTDAMVTARETIKSEQDKLNEEQKNVIKQQNELDRLRAAKKPDADAIKNALDDLKTSQATIKEIQAVLQENQDVLDKTTAGHNALVGSLKDEKQELIILAGNYDQISQKLTDAQKALDDIKKSRSDIVSSTTSQYSSLPSLDTTTSDEIAKARQGIQDAKDNLNDALKAKTKDSDAITAAQTAVAAAQASLAELLKGKTLDSAGNSVDQLATYEDALKHQTTAIGAYKSTLDHLRKLGLDDATYKKLVDDGVADAAFAKQLLAGGRTAVEKLNVLDANLQYVSKRLGTNVGHELFDSGVKAAQGLVDGLESKKDDVREKMNEIAALMEKTLNAYLKIKSPSQLFAEIGKFSVMGLAQGLTDNSAVISSAADNLAKNAVTAMQKSISDIATSELNLDPVITPILDLTTLRGQAQQLNNLIPINPSVSYGQASLISAQQTSTQVDQTTTAATSGPSVIFEQNNYSPEALSEIDIYRQTKNQISQLKSALALT